MGTFNRLESITSNAIDMTRVLLILLTGCNVVAAQETTFSEDHIHGRSAYILENKLVRIGALRGAGHIAEIRLKSDDPRKSVNPMLVHHYQTIDPGNYNPIKHDMLYGKGSDRILTAGYMGHLLNFPLFGAPSNQEFKNGLGVHGEALMVQWNKDKVETTANKVQFSYSTYLPKTQYKVGRTLTLAANETVLYVEEWVESQTAFGRPAHWVQHVTFGPPFVTPGRNVLDMSGTRGEVRPPIEDHNSLRAGPLHWPIGTSREGKKVSLREMQAPPNTGTYYGILMDPSREESYFTAFNKDLRVLIGYIWKTEDFPWIADWQENQSIDVFPWNGKVIARGLEFGTTPFAGSMKKVVDEGKLYGVRQYRWIEGRNRLTARYLAFITEIPDGYQGVESIECHGEKIDITERETGEIISLKSVRPW